MIADLLCFVARFMSGLQVRWVGCQPLDKQRVYFANHTSHLDFLVLWASLPKSIRKKVRPVAAKDYWDKGVVRRFISRKIINAVLIERHKKALPHDKDNPLNVMTEALKSKDSLIIFPEGGRSTGEAIQVFKSGLYYLIKSYPSVEFVPVYLENLNRILPKGEYLFVPILGSATFGKPVVLASNESKEFFLNRAKKSVEALRNDQYEDR